MLLSFSTAWIRLRDSSCRLLQLVAKGFGQQRGGERRQLRLCLTLQPLQSVQLPAQRGGNGMRAAPQVRNLCRIEIKQTQSPVGAEYTAPTELGYFVDAVSTKMSRRRRWALGTVSRRSRGDETQIKIHQTGLSLPRRKVFGFPIHGQFDHGQTIGGAFRPGMSVLEKIPIPVTIPPDELSK